MTTREALHQLLGRFNFARGSFMPNHWVSTGLRAAGRGDSGRREVQGWIEHGYLGSRSAQGVGSGFAPFYSRERKAEPEKGIAMALAVAGMAASGDTDIEDAECIAISFPEFPSLLDRGRKGER